MFAAEGSYALTFGVALTESRRSPPSLFVSADLRTTAISVTLRMSAFQQNKSTMYIAVYITQYCIGLSHVRCTYVLYHDHRHSKPSLLPSFRYKYYPMKAAVGC